MITPLYPISNVAATVTVVAPGALAGAELIPIAPLTADLPLGYILDFGSSKFAKLADAGAVDDEELTSEPLPTNLVPGDEVDIPGPAHPLLGGPKGSWAKLGGPDLSSDERAALQLSYHINAELALDLRAPLHTGNDADELTYAIVLQILFMLEHGITPSLVKATSQGGPSAATRTYRDRWIDPNAAAIVARVTGRKALRFEPFMAGV